MNNIYQQGRRKEYAVCKQLRGEGYDIVFRSAGSHSPIDVVAIDIEGRRVKLIQCKRNLSKGMMEVDEALKNKIEGQMIRLEALYRVSFAVV